MESSQQQRPESPAKSALKVWLPAIRAGSGADVFTERLADALGRHGIEATVSWFPHWSEFAPDMLRLAAAPNGIDVIHANSAYAFAFRRKGIPLVATEHHYVLDPIYRPYKSLAQHLYHRVLTGPCLQRSYAVSDAITTDSTFTAQVLSRVAGVQVTKAIPLWVDYDEFSPADASFRSIAGSQYRILFVGNSSTRKGADVIPILAERLGPTFEIRCTGGLRQQPQVEPPSNVRVLGRLSRGELVDEYRNCDAVLVPSRYEGFGYSALEAMACGKPVIGFRCGAIEEVVREAETALLCDIDDMDALESNCRKMEADRSMSKRYGEAGRVRAKECFSERAAIRSYTELYNRVLASYDRAGAFRGGA